MKLSQLLFSTALSAAVCAFSVGSPSFAQRVPHGAARAPSRTCVHFARSERADGRAIEFALDNACPIPVVATVHWTLACDGASDGRPEEHDEEMQSGERRVLVASAAACGTNGFSIEDVRWSWRRVSE